MGLTIEDMIARFGAPAILIGAALEGDVTMILAGVAAHLGLVGLPEVFGLGVLGGFVSDVAWYGVGHHRREAIRRSWFYRRAGPTIERLADRMGPWQIPASRFVYGTRIATMLLWGLRGLRLWRFVVVDVLGCVVWAVVLGGLGYFLTGSIEALTGHVRSVQLWLLAALVLSAVLFGFFHILFRWRRRTRGPRAGGAP